MNMLVIWMKRAFAGASVLLLVAAALWAAERAAAGLDMHETAAVAAWLLSAERTHRELLMVFSLAVIAVLPEELPDPFDKVPLFAWMWLVFVRAMKLFVSMQHPSMASQRHTEQSDGPGGSRTVTDTASMPVAPGEEPRK